jgi:Transcription factor WhiB
VTVGVGHHDWRRLCNEIADIANPPSWHHRAACRGWPVAWWFPESSCPNGREAQRARRICAGCPVQLECAVAGEGEKYGVWAGELKVKKPAKQPLRRLVG